jgi:hypothetical protein
VADRIRSVQPTLRTLVGLRLLVLRTHPIVISVVGFWLLFFIYPLNGTHHYVYSLGDRSLTDAESGPDEKTRKGFFHRVRDLKYCGNFLFRVGRVLFVLVPFINVDRPVFFLHPIFPRNVLPDATVVEEDHRLEEVVEHG